MNEVVGSLTNFLDIEEKSIKWAIKQLRKLDKEYRIEQQRFKISYNNPMLKGKSGTRKHFQNTPNH